MDPIVPMADPCADLVLWRDEIMQVIGHVVDSGFYILGPEVGNFERNLAKKLDGAGAVGVGCGTEGLVLALLAIGVGVGDEVITVSHTAGPTVAAVHMTGATPVLVDVDPETFCLDPQKLEAAVGPRTKAILPVHLYGHPADLDRVCEFARKRGLAVVEDCAQAQQATISGKMVGSIGDVGCFSFYPTKVLGALGDGGAVAAAEEWLVERLRQLRTYGWTKAQYAEFANGRCSRLDEMQAAILNVKLKYLDQSIERSRGLAHQYNQAFSDLSLVTPTERQGCRHVFHLYVVRCKERDELVRHLERMGVKTGRHYPFPAHVQPGLSAGARIPEPLTVTELLAQEIVTLPLFSGMTVEQQERVIQGVRSFFGKA
jgi:dTDP-4-amino-4,6-dideoxygalactose transaminase